MPSIPKRVTLTNSSVDILNVIRNNATQNYRDYVPKATENAESIREIGAVIMDYPALQNEFVNALINRIGRVVVTSKMYYNPLSMFKKGLLEFGESVEEIFVEIAKPFTFDQKGSESTLYKREIPNIKSAFHIMNYQKFYKVTISHQQLRQAFLSWSGVTDLITKTINSLYTGANYDEFLVMKYMIAKNIIDGKMYPVSIPTVESANMKAIVSTIKGISNNLEFMSDKYNLAGVHTHTLKNEQYILLNSNFDATMDVEVLASAFNMNKAEFMGNRVLVDSFGSLDNKRLAELFKDEPTYTEISENVLKALDDIPAVLCDKDWFMVFDNLQESRDVENGEGLYWNYLFHTWKTFSVSPFANNTVFVEGTPSVVSVSVSPAIASMSKGDSAFFKATVVTSAFAPKTVEWSIDSELSTIDNSGKLTIGSEEVATEITVTATSIYDNTKVGEAVITIA